jgi:hypothetical protein
VKVVCASRQKDGEVFMPAQRRNEREGVELMDGRKEEDDGWMDERKKEKRGVNTEQAEKKKKRNHICL